MSSKGKKNEKKKDIKTILCNIGKSILNFFNKHWPLILMNVIIFSLAVFIESIYIYNIGVVYQMLNTVLFIIIPTIIFCILGKVKSMDIIISIPVLYVLFLIFLNFCTMRDLYGITSGSLDSIPNYIDALFVVFIFTLVEYIPALIIKQIKKNK